MGDRTKIDRHNARVEKRQARSNRALTAEEQGQIVRAVLLAMTEGETLAEAAADEGVKPATVRGWIAATPGLMAEYLAVKKLQAQAWAEEAILVARESTTQSATKDRLLVDTLKWAAAKASPAEFGDKQMVEHQGAQEIKVRVVEDDHTALPANARGALKNAVEATVLSAGSTTVALLGTASSEEALDVEILD